MASVSLINTLPNEMLARTFDLLGLRDVLKSSHVCRRWRPIAFSTHCFSRYFDIGDVSPSAMDLTEYRLERGGTCPVTLCVHYEALDRMVESRILPFVEAVLPRVRSLTVTIDSMYRLQLEKSLSAPAPHLRNFRLTYVAKPLPEVPMTLPLSPTLFSGVAPSLRYVRLCNIILPRDTIKAFASAEHALFIHSQWTNQAKFPSYLFDFFPNVRHLRLDGGGMDFVNAPLPPHIIKRVKDLEMLHIEFEGEAVARFFRHLPMHDLPGLIICDSDEDGVYSALEPLRSPFHLSLYTASRGEFYISVKGDKSPLMRHFCEAFKYYVPGSPHTNVLFENDEFASQLATLKIQTSLWQMLLSWLPSYATLPKLIVEIDSEEFVTVTTLPLEPLPCPGLVTLVIQAKNDFAYVRAQDLLDFTDRVTWGAVELELCRVLIDGPKELLKTRFERVTYTETRYGPLKHPADI